MVSIIPVLQCSVIPILFHLTEQQKKAFEFQTTKYLSLNLIPFFEKMMTPCCIFIKEQRIHKVHRCKDSRLFV